MTTQTQPNNGALDALKQVKVGGATGGQDLPYPEPGRYRLAVEKCKAVQRWDGEAFFIVEFSVVTSQATEAGKSPHIPGAMFGWMQNLKHLSTPKNLTMFAAAAMGVAPNAVSNADVMAFCDEAGGQLPGGVLKASGVQVDALFFSGTSKKGNPITKVHFGAVEGKTLSALTK